MTAATEKPDAWFVDFQDVWLSYNEDLLKEPMVLMEQTALTV